VFTLQIQRLNASSTRLLPGYFVLLVGVTRLKIKGMLQG
jgi:hypothetical protein